MREVEAAALDNAHTFAPIRMQWMLCALLLLLLGCWMLCGLLYGNQDIAITTMPVDEIYTCSIQTLDRAALLCCSVGVMTGVGNQ